MVARFGLRVTKPDPFRSSPHAHSRRNGNWPLDLIEKRTEPTPPTKKTGPSDSNHGVRFTAAP